MLSKEQKLKYGQFLRQQIQEREKNKKNVRVEPLHAEPQPKIIPQNPRQQYHLPQLPKTPPINHDQFKNPRELEKEMLAKKMESIDYNPFGKIGGGAPNKDRYNIREIPNPPPNERNYQNNSRQQRNKSFENRINQQQDLYYQRPNSQKFGRGRANGPVQLYPLQKNQIYQPQQLKRIPTPEFLQGAYNNAPFLSPQFAPPAPYGYVAQQNNINFMGKIQLPMPKKLPFQPSFDPAVQNQIKMKQQVFKPIPAYNYPHPPIQMDKQQLKQNISHNEEIADIQGQLFKKGGRNLLKLENQTQQEIVAKQNQKIRLQQQLKRQMQEAARKKQQEKRKRLQEDQQLQRKNKEFLEREKLKYQQELKGKKNVAKNVEEINANIIKTNEQPVDLKKEKFKKIREQVAKREEQERRQSELKNMQNQKQNQDFIRSPQKQVKTPKIISNDLEQVASAISNQTVHSKGFNTAISKQFFKKEREKGKLQKFTEEVHKMRKQIAHQGAHFHQQLQKLQREADKAKREKQQADEQINRLKKQLREKMDINNKKYLEQIYQGKVEINDPYYVDEVKLQQKNVNVLKPTSNDQLIIKQYPSQEYIPDKNVPFDATNNSLVSLAGDSKKIPINILSNDSLSISKLGNFAKDTDYFHSNKKEGSYQIKQKFSPKQSIMQQDQSRNESRQSKRSVYDKPKQQLDRLIQSRKKSRGGWGQLSSVNGQIVDQIEKMLKHKERPKSHLSSMGQKSIMDYQNQNMKAKNENIYQSRKKDSFGGQRASEDQLNNLDLLLNKYM